MESSIDEIIDGQPIKFLLAIVTPGGGKSALPMIAGRLIAAGLADSLCWVVPRKSLQRQGEANFIDPFFRQMFDHKMRIRASTNDANPCRGLDGFVTTYQAIGVDENKTVLKSFKRRRYILVLDEFHHAEDEGVWHNALAPLVDRAAFVLLMTGTLERGDGNRIAFIPYVEHFHHTRPVLESSDQFGLRVIRYTRSDALAEKAIIPLSFLFADAAVRFRKENGDEIQYDSMAQVKRKDAAAAVYTALDTDYAMELMTLAIDHWTGYRRHHRRGKLLVVTAGIKHARQAVKFLKTHGLNTEIATSHESAAAQKAIDQFKAGKIDILVTIAMAYEGLDVPSVSHLVCLTHIRSRPWIEQMLARAVRVNHAAGPWESQRAYIFAPDDLVMRDIVSRIEAEQEPFVKRSGPQGQLSLFEGDNFGNGKKGGSDYNPYNIVPLSSSLTSRRDLLIGGDPASIIPSAPADEKTPSELEADLRDQIEKHVRTYSFMHRYRNGRINREIKCAMEKPRDQMSLRELTRCFDYVKKTYPLTQQRTIQLPGVSGPRAIRERVFNPGTKMGGKKWSMTMPQ